MSSIDNIMLQCQCHECVSLGIKIYTQVKTHKFSKRSTIRRWIGLRIWKACLSFDGRNWLCALWIAKRTIKMQTKNHLFDLLYHTWCFMCLFTCMCVLKRKILCQYDTRLNRWGWIQSIFIRHFLFAGIFAGMPMDWL